MICFKNQSTFFSCSGDLFFRNITSGFPEEFTLVYTLRVRKSPKYPWNIIKIVDAKGAAQFLITMNPKKQTLEISLLDHEETLQTVSFVNDRVSVTHLSRRYRMIVYTILCFKINT